MIRIIFIIAIVLSLITLLCTTFGIWSGDDRWFSTAWLSGVPAVVAWIVATVSAAFDV